MPKKYIIIIILIPIGLCIFFGCTMNKNLHNTKNTGHLSKKTAGTNKDTKPAGPNKSEEQAKERGCLSCHEGIAVINQRMQPYLLGYAVQKYGKGKGYECAICHEGNPGSAEKSIAHDDLIPNPSSMWVLHEGKGCAKCHDSEGSITHLMGEPLEQPAGGELMSPQSFSEDEIDYTYRLALSLHSLTIGIASKNLSSNGVIPKGTFPYGNVDMIDTDGQTPRVGSEKYKKWVKKAINEDFLRILDKVEEIPDYEKGLEVFQSEEKAGFSDIYRKQCGRCHVWGEGRRKRGDLRASGCAACHVVYGNDGKYEGDDSNIKNNEDRPHALRHRITTAIPSAQCTHCHTRGRRIGTTFMGMFEYDYIKDAHAPPFDENAEPQEPLFTKEYLHVRKDVHFERGMHCVDCHTSIDVHGDGNIYPTTVYQVEITCYDCHGTPNKYPWELPVGHGTLVTLEGERGVMKKGNKEYLLTSRGNASTNWLKENKKAYVTGKLSGKKHEIPLLKEVKKNDAFKTQQGKVAMSIIPEHIEKMECYACHSTWAPQCFGCHEQYDRREEGIDWIATSKNVDPITGRQTIVNKAGDLSLENRSFMRWEAPILGVNVREMVSPLAPGCQVFYTFVDEEGNIKARNKHYTTSSGHNSPTLAPINPHSVTLVSRTCEDCHTDPKAIGYGTGNSRSAGKLLGDSPLFQDLSKGVYGDVEGAKTGRWQVPRIVDFPYSLDQLITRSGKQIQNMPFPEDRPLNTEERNFTEREGVCLGCHQYHGTDKWKKIIEKYGEAKTAEQHEKIVSEAIKSLMEINE